MKTAKITMVPFIVTLPFTVTGVITVSAKATVHRTLKIAMGRVPFMVPFTDRVSFITALVIPAQPMVTGNRTAMVTVPFTGQFTVTVPFT